MPDNPRTAAPWLFFGLVLGILPLAAWALALFGILARLGMRQALANGNALIIALIGYGVAFVAAFACLRRPRTRYRARYFGYGLLAAVLATPIIVAIGCEVYLFTFQL